MEHNCEQEVHEYRKAIDNLQHENSDLQKTLEIYKRSRSVLFRSIITMMMMIVMMMVVMMVIVMMMMMMMMIMVMMMQLN